MYGKRRRKKTTPQNESCVTFRNRHMLSKEETQLKHKRRVSFHRAEITLEEKERGQVKVQILLQVQAEKIADLVNCVSV